MFSKVKKNFGFGCMRLPVTNGEIDYEQFKKMIDLFISKGFNYFDTAHVYHSGLSEIALRECLVKRYKREDFVLTNKLSGGCFKTAADIRPLLEEQLTACGVDYFDFYLMHAQSKLSYEHFKECHAYETAFKLKQEGKVKHVGISFHDTHELLDEILTTYPEIEVVQLQINYVDYDDVAVQGKLCYEVCEKHHKPVIVMEPVKGGNLVNLPAKANKILSDLNNGSNASYAIRYAASFENVIMVLSGMSNLAQVEDNVSFMENFIPLNQKEYDAIDKVIAIFKSMNLIACTSCRYCIDGCPKKISIPDLFACMNAKNIYSGFGTHVYYQIHTKGKGKASDCIKCGKCEIICPQHLKIRDLLIKVKEEFEKE